MEKTREFQKNIYFCFLDYAKAFDCMDHNKLWKILEETGIPDHLICLLRNLYAGQKQLEARRQKMDKAAVVCIYNGILLSHKKNEFDLVLVRWMNLEPVMKREVSQKEKTKYGHMCVCVCVCIYMH